MSDLLDRYDELSGILYENGIFPTNELNEEMCNVERKIESCIKLRELVWNRIKDLDELRLKHSGLSPHSEVEYDILLGLWDQCNE